jgi:tetratricopeptide (TPR) repeat protein
MDFEEDADVDEEIISIINAVYDLDETRWLISLIAGEVIILEKVEEGQRIAVRINKEDQGYSEVIIDDKIDNAEALLKVLGKPFTARIRNWRITREQFTNPPGIAEGCDLTEKTWQEKLLLSFGLSFEWAKILDEGVNIKQLLYDSIRDGNELGIRQALALDKEVVKNRSRFARHSFFSVTTPLMVALTLEEEKFSIIKLLIAAGADLIRKVGRPAECALDIIERKHGGNVEILRLLQNRPDAADISRWYVGLGERVEKAQGVWEVLKYYERAQEINPENIIALSKLSLIYSKQGDSTQAKTWLDETTNAIERHSGMIEAAVWYNLGMCVFNKNNYEKAIWYFGLALKSPIIGKAEEIKCKRRNINFYCGRAYYESGDYISALKHYKEAKRFTSASDDADFRIDLDKRMALVCEALGDNESAEKHTAEARRIIDDNNSFHEMVAMCS